MGLDATGAGMRRRSWGCAAGPAGRAAGPWGRRPMKAAPFGYHRATSVAEAVELLDGLRGNRPGDRRRPEPGPHDEHAADPARRAHRRQRLAELAEIRVAGDTTVVGAMVRYTTLEQSPDRRRAAPAAGPDGSPHRRPAGPQPRDDRRQPGPGRPDRRDAARLPGARCDASGVVGPAGVREIPVEELYEGSYATVLDPCEVVTEIVFPQPPGPSRVRRDAAGATTTSPSSASPASAIGHPTAAGATSGWRSAASATPRCSPTRRARSLHGSRLSDEDIARGRGRPRSRWSTRRRTSGPPRTTAATWSRSTCAGCSTSCVAQVRREARRSGAAASGSKGWAMRMHEEFRSTNRWRASGSSSNSPSAWRAACRAWRR